MASKLRVGIIGLGGIARSHAEAIAALDTVEIGAVADLFADKREQFMQKWGVDTGYQSHTDLLLDDSIDAVAITLGHQLHQRLTIDACNAGKHVLVEKPMAINLEQCDQMIAAADANRVKLMVGHTQHFYGTSRKAKQLLDAGEIGSLMSVVCYMSKNWGFAGRRPQYRSRYHGGGMLLTNGVHVIDRMLWLMASQPVSVAATVATRAHYQASDDTSTVFVRCKNGLGGVAVACGYADGAPNFESHVIGTHGTVRFSQHGEKFVKLGKGDEWQDVPFDDPKQEFLHEWEAFARAITDDVEPPADGAWGRQVMAVAFAAEQSSITGHEVMLETGTGWVTQSTGSPITIEHGWH